MGEMVCYKDKCPQCGRPPPGKEPQPRRGGRRQPPKAAGTEFNRKLFWLEFRLEKQIEIPF